MIKSIMKSKSSYFEVFLDYINKTISDGHLVLPFQATQQIFLLSLNDYFDKKIDINTFSSISTSLYYDFNRPSSFDDNPVLSTLGNLLSSASDLEWLIKNKSEKETEEILVKLKKYKEDFKA